MKKTNRLIIFALSLAIVISALVGINVSAAEDEGALDIKSINLVYGDKVELLIAVDISNDERDNVEVTYTLNGEKKTAELHPEEFYTEEETNAKFPVFRTIGIAPKDIGEVMTFEAHIKGSGATGTAYSASILDYLYARLYRDGFINETEEGENLAKKNLYLNTINYASSALEVLVNYKQGKSEPLYSTYVFAWGADSTAKVASDRYFGAFVPGTEVTPIYVGEGEIAEWNLYAANGEAAGTLAADTAYALAAHTKFEAVLAEIEEPDPEEPPVVEDTVTIMDYQSGASNAFVSSKDGDGNAVTGNLPANANTLTMGLATEGDNKFLQVRNYKNSGKIGVTTAKLSNTVQEGNCYTFETKINIKGCNAGYNFAQLKFVNNNNGEAVNLFLGMATVESKTGLAIATTGDNSSIAKGTKLFDATDKVINTASGWFTLRIEFYFGGVGTENASNTFMKLYVDDILAFDGQANWAMGANISHAQIDHISSGVTHNSCYDDISFTRTDKAYAKGEN